MIRAPLILGMVAAQVLTAPLSFIVIYLLIAAAREAAQGIIEVRRFR